MGERRRPRRPLELISTADFVRYINHINERPFIECDLATRRTGRLVTRVIDARGINMQKFSMRFARANAEAAKLSEDAYLQLLGAAFICNVSPALKMLWETALTRLLPKRVLEKAFVLMPLASAKDRERLAQWIPEDHLPAAVGGKVELGHAV